MIRFGDQANGLRRLLRQAPPQVVSVATFGPDAVRWLAREARTGAAAGRQTVVFDEVGACGSLADAYALSARFDLLQAVDRHVGLESVCVEAGQGLNLFPAARMAKALVGADRILAARFAQTCQRLQAGADLWLVHARSSEDFVLSPLAAAAHRLVVVVEGNARSVTSAYSLIKQLAEGPWPQIDLALAGGRDSRDAEALIANLGAMVLAHSGLALRRINRLEASAAAAAMVSDEQERERFLERVLGFARRGSRTLAFEV